MSQAGVPPGQGNPPGYGHSPSPTTPQGPTGAAGAAGPGPAGGQKGGTLPMSAVPDLMGLMPNQPGGANYGAPPNQPNPSNYGVPPTQPGGANYGVGQNYAPPNQPGPVNYGAQNYAPPNQPAPANYGAQNYVPPNQPAPANYGAQNYGYSPGAGAPGSNQVAPGYVPDPRLNQARVGKRSSVGLMLVLGGIGVIALIAAGAGAYWYRQRAVSLERQLTAAAAARNSVTQYGIKAGALEGDCRKAYDCCVAITSKAEAQSLLAQCEVFKLAGRQPSECTSALVGYRKVAASNGLSCD